MRGGGGCGEHTAALSGMWRSPIAKTNREVMTGSHPSNTTVDLPVVYGGGGNGEVWVV